MPQREAIFANKIGCLPRDFLAAERERSCRLTIATLEWLVPDQLPRVRAALAEEIRSLDCVPKSVVQVLARDAEETICAPILEYFLLPSGVDLMVIVGSARAHTALAAGAQRRGLGESVSKVVVVSLHIPL